MQKRLTSRLDSPLRQRISHKPLMLLAFAGICTRMFALLAIDLPEMHNALWLVPLLGAIMSLPAILSAYVLLKRSQMSLEAALKPFLLRPAAFFAGGIFVFEAAAVFSLVSQSASYATLYENSEGWLLFVTFAAVAIISVRGGNSAGGISSIWMILTPLMYFPVLLSQRSVFQLRWLFPLFGPGLRELWRGAQLCAFYFSLLPFLMLLDDGVIPLGPGKRKKAGPESLLRLFLICAVTVSLLCAIHAAFYPVLPDLSDSRSLRIDLFLSTGKANRTAQLPLLLMWYASLIVCAVFFVYAGGRMLALTFARDSTIFPLLSASASFLLAACSLSDENATLSLAYTVSLPLIAFWLIALIVSLLRRTEGKP